MKAFAETFNECVFLENLYIYIYIPGESKKELYIYSQKLILKDALKIV